MASCGYSDEDQTTNLNEEVGLHRGNVPTNRARRGRIVTVQIFFSESDGMNFLR